MSIAPSRCVIIAIDGPAAAGKGTLARRLAAHLGLPYLDTGLLYRATGRRVLDAGADPANPEAAERAARTLMPADLDRIDLRGPAADKAASEVAAIRPVRAALLDFQRQFGRAHGAVLDGRDIGTVIFPNATAKFFITASPEARSLRRFKEAQSRGEPADLAHVTASLLARDALDESRSAAPLIPAGDAILLDTTYLDANAVFTLALSRLAPLLGR